MPDDDDDGATHGSCTQDKSVLHLLDHEDPENRRCGVVFSTLPVAGWRHHESHETIGKDAGDIPTAIQVPFTGENNSILIGLTWSIAISVVFWALLFLFIYSLIMRA